MGRIVALVDERSSPGFELAGIESHPTPSVETMTRSVEAIFKEAEIEVVILEEELFRALPEGFQRRIEESTSPIFVPVRTIRRTSDQQPSEEYLARMIRRAIGYQIKIRR